MDVGPEVGRVTRECVRQWHSYRRAREPAPDLSGEGGSFVGGRYEHVVRPTGQESGEAPKGRMRGLSHGHFKFLSFKLRFKSESRACLSSSIKSHEK